MSVPEELSRAVRARARGRCQYGLMHESLQGATFHVTLNTSFHNARAGGQI
jgi:hypothetical protein